MRTSLRKSFFAIITAVSALSAAPAFAASKSLAILWSGASFNNSATAKGWLTFDDSALPELGAQNIISLPSSSITELSITVSGSSAGNGTFGLADFSGIYFSSPTPLNLNQELIGQAVGNGCAFGPASGACDTGNSGDFNLFRGQNDNAPSGTWYFKLTTAGGEDMLVTSMAPIPEPTTYGLMLSGLALGAVWARRRTPAE